MLDDAHGCKIVDRSNSTYWIVHYVEINTMYITTW